MKRSVRRLMCVMILACVSFGGVGCTALQDGFKAGLSDGFSAALAAIIEAPINYVINQTFGSGS